MKCFADELPHQKQALYYVQHIAHFMVAPKHLDMCNTTIRKCISDAYVRHAMALQKSMSVVSAPEVMSMAGIDTSSIPRELIESLSQARYGVSGEENDHSKYVNLVSVGNSSSQPRSAASRLANKPKRSLQLDSIDSSNVDGEMKYCTLLFNQNQLFVQMLLPHCRSTRHTMRILQEPTQAREPN